LPTDAKNIREKGRLQPGRMFIVDTVQGRIIDDVKSLDLSTARSQILLNSKSFSFYCATSP